MLLFFALALHGQDDTQSPQGLTDNSSSPGASTTDAPQEPAPAYYSRFRLHAYSDVDFSHGADAGAPNRFSVNEIDLFGTAAIAPGFSALTELVLDTGDTASTASVPFNVERLLVQYRLNDYLKVEAGQFRTAIGYYSTAYLRGAWFQTAISRPRMFAFEEDGGILPLHTVGVSASGLIPSGPLGLHWVAETGNTRTWGTSVTPTNPTSSAGRNAVNVSLFVTPRAVPGLDAGFSDFHDTFTPLSGETVNRMNFTAHVVYVANRIEFLNEGVIASIHDVPADATGRFTGFYSQLGYRFGSNWGPYVRVEKLSIHADPFFAPIAYIADWRSMYTAGVRYDWNDHVAVKLELGHEADWGSPHYFQAAMQIAFAF